MKITNAQRKSILKSYLNNISHVADEEYQKRVWIRGEGPECDDFGETANQFFAIEEVLEHSVDYNISEDQRHLLAKFYEAFDAFSPEPHDQSEEFISSPEWQKIIKMAQNVLKSFHYHKYPKGFSIIIDDSSKNVTAEIFYQCKRWASISHCLTVQFYPPDGSCWDMPLDNAIEALTRAKKELLEYLEEVAKPS